MKELTDFKKYDKIGVNKNKLSTHRSYFMTFIPKIFCEIFGSSKPINWVVHKTKRYFGGGMSFLVFFFFTRSHKYFLPEKERYITSHYFGILIAGLPSRSWCFVSRSPAITPQILLSSISRSLREPIGILSEKRAALRKKNSLKFEWASAVPPPSLS